MSVVVLGALTRWREGGWARGECCVVVWLRGGRVGGRVNIALYGTGGDVVERRSSVTVTEARVCVCVCVCVCV